MTQQELDALACRLNRCLRCGHRIYCNDLVVKIILGDSWGVAHSWSSCFSPREDVVAWTGIAGELSRIEFS